MIASTSETSCSPAPPAHLETKGRVEDQSAFSSPPSPGSNRFQLNEWLLIQRKDGEWQEAQIVARGPKDTEVKIRYADGCVEALKFRKEQTKWPSSSGSSAPTNSFDPLFLPEKIRSPTVSSTSNILNSLDLTQLQLPPHQRVLNNEIDAVVGQQEEDDQEERGGGGGGYAFNRRRIKAVGGDSEQLDSVEEEGRGGVLIGESLHQRHHHHHLSFEHRYHSLAEEDEEAAAANTLSAVTTFVSTTSLPTMPTEDALFGGIASGQIELRGRIRGGAGGERGDGSVNDTGGEEDEERSGNVMLKMSEAMGAGDYYTSQSDSSFKALVFNALNPGYLLPKLLPSQIKEEEGGGRDQVELEEEKKQNEGDEAESKLMSSFPNQITASSSSPAPSSSSSSSLKSKQQFKKPFSIKEAAGDRDGGMMKKVYKGEVQAELLGDAEFNFQDTQHQQQHHLGRKYPFQKGSTAYKRGGGAATAGMGTTSNERLSRRKGSYYSSTRSNLGASAKRWQTPSSSSSSSSSSLSKARNQRRDLQIDTCDFKVGEDASSFFNTHATRRRRRRRSSTSRGYYYDGDDSNDEDEYSDDDGDNSEESSANKNTGKKKKKEKKRKARTRGENNNAEGGRKKKKAKKRARKDLDEEGGEGADEEGDGIETQIQRAKIGSRLYVRGN
eukprot:jgi/Bigna1/141624/aug1.64_g16332